MPALLENPNLKLKKLDFGRQHLTSSSISLLAQFIRSSTTLESLNFEFCELGAANTVTIVEAISASSASLKKLDLTYNQIGIGGARALSTLLAKKPSNVEWLSICANHNMALGFVFILDEITDQTNLAHLDCSCICINEDRSTIVEAIAKMISENASIKTLNLGANYIWDSEGALIFKALKDNSSIQNLSLRNSSGSGAPMLGAETAKALGKVLSENSTLQSLDLWAHEIFKGDNALPILEALNHNTTLTKIEAGNIVGYADNIEDINQLLKRNVKISSGEIEELKDLINESMTPAKKTNRQTKPFSYRDQSHTLHSTDMSKTTEDQPSAICGSTYKKS